MAREFAKATYQASEIKRRREEGEFVDSPMPLKIKSQATALAQIPASSAPTLSRVVQHLLDDYGKAAPMSKKRQAALGLLLEFLGDIPVSQIRQLDIDGYFDMVSQLPPRWADEGRRKGTPVKDLAKLKHPLTLSPKTFAYSYMASIRRFLAEARRLFGDNGFPRHLTVEGVKHSPHTNMAGLKSSLFSHSSAFVRVTQKAVSHCEPATTNRYARVIDTTMSEAAVTRALVETHTGTVQIVVHGIEMLKLAIRRGQLLGMGFMMGIMK